MNKNERTMQSVIVQSLYLCNLLLLPGVSFLILVFRFYQHSPITGYLKIHYVRALQLSILNALLLLVLPLFFIINQQASAQSLMTSLFFFICLHACFVLIGMVNLSRAMANKVPVF